MSKRVNLPLCIGLLLGSGLVISSVAAQDAVTQPVLQRSEEQVSTWLEQHRDRPPIVRAFVQRMPKGGDIHTHLSGAVYAERYLSWVAADGYCVDAVVIKLVLPRDCSKTPNAFSAAELFKRSGVYAALIDRWSLRYPAFAGKSGHDQFFQAFDGFDLISSSPSRKGDMVADVANRAASQHVSYLELLLTTQGGATQQLARSIGWNPTNFASSAVSFWRKDCCRWLTMASKNSIALNVKRRRRWDAVQSKLSQDVASLSGFCTRLNKLDIAS